MKKLFLAMGLITAGHFAQSATAQKPVAKDSLLTMLIDNIDVKGVRGPQNAPYAITDIAQKRIAEFSKTGRELPMLFAQTPGIVAWGENGLGTGTTYMRIRGSAGSRINVTIDGVPLNSPEDQCVFWANMNSYGAFLKSAQIQRGIGSSTLGDGAFGGTISLQTQNPAPTPSLNLNASYGSFNTYNFGGSISTGIFAKRLAAEGGWHETNTDGYIHGTDGRSGSFYGMLAYLGENVTVKYRNIGNYEKTGQAWNGVTAGNDDMSIMDGTYGLNTGIRTYKDMYNKGLGKFNSLYESFIYNDLNDYSTERYAMSDGSYWPHTTDNFWQDHNILSAAYDISHRLKATASLRYTHGHGYYEEFRYNNKLKKFGLSNYETPDGSTVKRSDFVRKKGLKQDTYGMAASLIYVDKRWDVVGGVSAQLFSGNHYGYLTYVGNDVLRAYLMKDGDYKYYDSDADKNDINTYVKAQYSLSKQLDLFGELQYRHVSYKTDGYNDKFIDNGDGTYSKHYLDIDKKYDFFNPKAGVSYTNGNHRVYASVALGHREPERNNFTDNGKYPAPKAEQLLDYEAGYNFTTKKFNAGVNVYYMDYTDQFVQTGEASDIGEPLTTNIKDSYRAGVEIVAQYALTDWLTLEGNAALSTNKIKDFDEYVEDWDDWSGNPDAQACHTDGDGDGLRRFHYDNSTLAFSPSTILNGFIDLHYNGFKTVIHTNFVSRQYLDNTENNDRSLPCYSTTNVNLSYTSKVKKAAGLKEIAFGLDFWNIFARRYAANGWVYSAIAESYGHANDNRYYQIGFIPSAGFTVMSSISLRF